MKIGNALALALSFMLIFSACSGPGGESGGEFETKPLSELMEQVTDGAADDIMAGDIEITDENFKSFLFIDPVDGAEALASEAQVNAIAHSVVLLRVPEGADAADTAAKIKAAADPRKWICVEAEKTEVVQRGRLILLVMSNEQAVDRAVKNFKELK